MNSAEIHWDADVKLGRGIRRDDGIIFEVDDNRIRLLTELTNYEIRRLRLASSERNASMRSK